MTAHAAARGLHHIGYWTDDLDAAMAQATRLLGVGPFQVLNHVDLGDFRFRGEPGHARPQRGVRGVGARAAGTGSGA